MQISSSMQISFSSLALVNNPFDWAYGLEELGFTGWEVVSEGKQQLNDGTLFDRLKILSRPQILFLRFIFHSQTLILEASTIQYGKRASGR